MKPNDDKPADLAPGARALARRLPVETPGSTPPLEILREIYARCDLDTRIAIGSRRPTKSGTVAPHYLTNIAVRDLDQALPGIMEFEIDRTQYMILNTLRGSVAVGLFEGEPQYYAAKTDNLAELNAFYADLDVGRDGKPWPKSMPAHVALGVVAEEARQGRIPMPSYLALSGRGVYLIWLLRGESLERGFLPKATHQNLELWRQIAGKLGGKLGHLCNDQQTSSRAISWLKRPGTLDTLKDSDGNETKSGKRVVWWASLGDTGRVPLYTLEGLRESLGVSVAEPPPMLPVATPAPPRSAPTRAEVPTKGAPIKRPRKGGKKRNVEVGQGGQPHRSRVREIDALNNYRGGLLRNTCRRKALFYYSIACRSWFRVNNPGDAAGAWAYAVSQSHRLNRTFRPPLTLREVDAVFKNDPQKNPRARLRASGATIARDLMVTAEEVEALQLRHIVPAEIATARKAAKLAAEADRRGQVARVRDEIDRRILAGDGPSEIARIVSELTGELVTKQRVDARRKILARRGLDPQLRLDPSSEPSGGEAGGQPGVI
jgi:hypothetical protein